MSWLLITVLITYQSNERLDSIKSYGRYNSEASCKTDAHTWLVNNHYNGFTFCIRSDGK